MSLSSKTRGWRSILFGSAKSARRRSAPHRLQIGRRLRFEKFEARELLTAIPIAVNVPDDIQVKDIYLQVSAVLTEAYQPKSGPVLPANSVVYYDHALEDYALAKPGGDFVFQLTSNGEEIQLPNAYATGGHIVIGIGSPPNVQYTPKGISTPTAATNPYNIFGLFEYAIDGHGLDIDLSEVDQVGFPFTITTTPSAPVPANDGVGITIPRMSMFDMYADFITSQGATAALFQQASTDGYPYRIVAPQNLIAGGASVPLLHPVNYLTGGSLTIDQPYYYWITATDNGGAGETIVSNVQQAVPYNLSYRSINYPQQTVVLGWAPYEGATGYNIYRSVANDPRTAHRIGSATATQFKDTGLPLGKEVPPTNNYSYDGLNSYFNTALVEFFDHYTAKDSFKLERDGHLFQGETSTWVDPTTKLAYTVLNISPTTGPFKDQEFLIFRPFFSTNTNIHGMVAPPAWMPHPDQSPGAMVLAADGVFNTGGAQPVVDSKTLSDLENSIASAFNRGIANNFNIAPSNWAAEPALNSATAIETPPATNKLAPNTTYYYMMTAENGYGETTTSLVRQATTTSTEKTVLLEFSPQSSPTSYNIYRSLSPTSGFTLIHSVTNPANNIHSFVDTGFADGTVTPPIYYAPNSTSNWYAAFWHQNSTIDPTNGVSINGLAYGFAYDDQGGSSTNFQGFFTQVDINIGQWAAN
ncbi:MAG: hypothetical protein KF708_09255 [Pirellulales bacterium]|nr:hypothetical protein [Pirellulales bacterium]